MSQFTDEQIETEVLRVAKVVRGHLRKASEEVDEEGASVRYVQQWVVGSLILLDDEDGYEVERVASSFETGSPTLQVGLLMRMQQD